MQAASINYLHHANILVTKSHMFANIYDGGTQRDVFIVGAEQAMRHSRWNYWAMSAQAKYADNSFQVELLLAILNGSGQQSKVCQDSAVKGHLYHEQPLGQRSTINNVYTGSTTPPPHRSDRQKSSQPVTHAQQLSRCFFNADLALCSSLMTPPTGANTWDLCCEPSHFASWCLLLKTPRFAILASVR